MRSYKNLERKIMEIVSFGVSANLKLQVSDPWCFGKTVNDGLCFLSDVPNEGGRVCTLYRDECNSPFFVCIKINWNLIRLLI